MNKRKDTRRREWNSRLEPRAGKPARVVLRGERISNDPDLLDNLQVWYEYNYNTNLLHSNLAFPLLKKLTEVGDPLASRMFKEEIAKRIISGNLSVMTYLCEKGYLECFNKEEIASFFEGFDFTKITFSLLRKLSRLEVPLIMRVFKEEIAKGRIIDNREWDVSMFVKNATEIESDKVFRWDVGYEKACAVLGFKSKRNAYTYMTSLDNHVDDDIDAGKLIQDEDAMNRISEWKEPYECKRDRLGVFEWDNIHKVPLDKIIKFAIDEGNDKVFRWDIGHEKACALFGFDNEHDAYMYMTAPDVYMAYKDGEEVGELIQGEDVMHKVSEWKEPYECKRDRMLVFEWDNIHKIPLDKIVTKAVELGIVVKRAIAKIDKLLRYTYREIIDVGKFIKEVSAARERVKVIRWDIGHEKACAVFGFEREFDVFMYCIGIRLANDNEMKEYRGIDLDLDLIHAEYAMHESRASKWKESYLYKPSIYTYHVRYGIDPRYVLYDERVKKEQMLYDERVKKEQMLYDEQVKKELVFEWDDVHKVPLDKIVKKAIEMESDKVFRWDVGYEKACAVLGFENEHDVYTYMTSLNNHVDSMHRVSEWKVPYKYEWGSFQKYEWDDIHKVPLDKIVKKAVESDRVLKKAIEIIKSMIKHGEKYGRKDQKRLEY